MDELKPCPWCGSKPEYFDSSGENRTDMCWCTNRRCSARDPMTVIEWNTRPLEDALRAENDVLKVSINNLDRELENTVKDCDALRAQLDKSIPIEIRTANWIMEKNNRVFALAAERDNLRAQLDIAVKFIEYMETPMSEPITPREQVAQYRAIDALSEIAKLGGGK